MGRASAKTTKAQSAMEYLMTYGWAILIIAVVVAALFSLGVFNGAGFAPKARAGSCTVFRSVQGITLAGQCNNLQPQYVANFRTASSSHIDIGSFVPLYGRSFTVTL